MNLMVTPRLFTARNAIPLVWSGRRTIFSQEFMGMEKFLRSKDQYRQEIEEDSSLRSRELASTANVLLSDDVKKYMYLANNLEDSVNVGNILRDYVNKTKIQVRNVTSIKLNRQLTSEFLLMCHNLKVLEPAEQLLQDEEYLELLGFQEDGKPSATMFGIYLKYAQLLYNAGKHQEVIDFYDFIMKDTVKCQIPLSVLSVVLASCYKLNSPQIFEKATAFLDQAQMDDRHITSLGRAGLVYSLLAVRQSQFEMAYDILSFVRNSNAKNNLKVYILVKLERVEDALKVMSNSVRELDDPTVRMDKVKYSIEAVDSIAKKAEEQDDIDVKKKVSVLFSKMDNVAQVVQDSLEDMVLSEIPATFEPRFIDSRTRQFRRQPIDQRSFTKDLERSLDA